MENQLRILCVTLSFLTFFESTLALAESSAADHFDLVETNRAANEFAKFKGTVGSSSAPSCVPIRGSQGDSVMSCSVPDSEIDKNVILKTNEFPEGKIPPQIQAVLPKQFVKDVEKKKVTCVFNFRTINDNQQMIGCKGENQNRNPAAKTSGEKCGDDWGRTHGLQIGLSCQSADGLSQTFTYSTDLFTDPNRNSRYVDDKGISHMDQKFVSENIFAYVEDNMKQGKFSYWRRGVGFINLSSKEKWGFMQSTGQQKWFHELRNEKNPGEALDYRNIDGKQDDWGAFVTLATGLQGSKQFGSFCNVSASAEVGARVATLKESNFVYGSANTKFGVQVGDGQLYARAGYELIQRPSSAVGEGTLALGYERNSGSRIEFGVKQQMGNREDVPDTPNLIADEKKNDALVYMQINYAF